MSRAEIGDLRAFAAVAQHRNFTRAAAELGLSLPTVSQTIRGLEERLGVRLLNRTTRSVALTEAGARLLGDVEPILLRLDEALENVNAFRDKPMGSLKLAVMRPFASRLVAPLLRPFLAEYPEIRVELVVEDARTDLVKGGFDAGIRVGHQVERDMSALPITGPYRMIAVAAPSYFAARVRPQRPNDLHAHDCIQARAPYDGAIMPWTFVNGDQRVEVAVAGGLTVNDADVWLQCVLDGLGVGYIPEPMCAPHLARGELINLLEDWYGERSGAFLYHPSRRQPPAPLNAFIGFIQKRQRENPLWPGPV
jgi:DNA-binding transcriptional LysR family regulator